VPGNPHERGGEEPEDERSTCRRQHLETRRGFDDEREGDQRKGSRMEGGTDDLTAARRIFDSVGMTVALDEAQMDAVTGLSGSGPAYVFYFIEALARAGTELGLTEGQARQLAVQTFAGAAQLAADSSEPLQTLRQRVTSKGGTTAAALSWLESNAVEARIVEAVHAAHRRAREMGEEFGRQ